MQGNHRDITTIHSLNSWKLHHSSSRSPGNGASFSSASQPGCTWRQARGGWKLVISGMSKVTVSK